MDSILRTVDEQVATHLRDEAGTTIQHQEDSTIGDTLRTAVHELRSRGFGGSNRPGDADVYSDAVWICHTDVLEALMDSLDLVEVGDSVPTTGFAFQSYDVLSSDAVPRDFFLLLDTKRAITENPHRHRHLSRDLGRGPMDLKMSMPMPVLVTQPDGIVHVDISR